MVLQLDIGVSVGKIFIRSLLEYNMKTQNNHGYHSIGHDYITEINNDINDKIDKNYNYSNELNYYSFKDTVKNLNILLENLVYILPANQYGNDMLNITVSDFSDKNDPLVVNAIVKLNIIHIGKRKLKFIICFVYSFCC